MDDGRREFWKVWGAVLALTALGILLTWQMVGDAPPRTLRVATGTAGGGYDRAGLALRDTLAESEITVELVQTRGSVENLTKLANGEVDFVFSQSGIDHEGDGFVGDGPGFVGVASLYYEPLWIFVRAGFEARGLHEFGGARIQVGAPGSGTRAVATALLAANGIDAEDATLQEDGVDSAVDALGSGASDVLFLVTAPDSERIHDLFRNPDVRPFDLERAHAYGRRYRYLQQHVLTPGMIDFANELPARDVRLVAPCATLVARADLHPAIFPLVIEAVQPRFARGGLFEEEGEFPAAKHLDHPVAEAAARFFRDGPSFLYRVLPFQVAATIDRLKVLLLPLLTLLLPLIRIAPPLYRWRIRRRITRWYRAVIDLERRVNAQPTAAGYAAACDELDRLQDEVSRVRVPLGYAEELYNLRMHFGLVRREFEERRGGAAG